ncbi:MAG: glucose-1-phosphate adenylyltransferase [Phaeodactylibacter sp.]|nr:glucose-1-phosphate adenylyltransferase [Phaeodactylibacter sp.]MCB9048026.1 glucose-1-phosphate adenylyltransferase [Lewinellaceae bacterium]
MIKMISLILGGGAGTRLAPLTSERSKPAVPIGGKYRLIDIPISNCLNSGVRRMFVVTQYNSASLNQHIKNTYNFDMFSHGFVDILAAEQTPNSDKWFQGTADAVRQSLHHLKRHLHDYILILSGDQLYQMNFAELAEYHIEKEADLTIATIPVIDKDAPGFGIMKVNEQGYIEDFIEKPKPEVLGEWQSHVEEKYKNQGRHYLASMGIYIFNKAFLHKLFDEYPEATDFGKDFIPIAIKQGSRVASFAFDGYWTDIGTIRSFYEANIALTDNIPEFNLFDNDKTVYTRPRLLAPSKIFGTWFNQAVIAEGCIIHAKKIERSIVGIRSRIGDGTEISNAIIMGNDSYETIEEMQKSGKLAMGIGENCNIRNAIIDKDVRIGNNVNIHGSIALADGETDTYVIKDGIIVVKKGVTIEPGTRIGLGA